MPRDIRDRCRLFGGLAAAALLTVAVAAAEAATLTLAHGLPKGSSYDVGAEKLKELVEARTDGEVEIRIICCARMGSDEEMFRRVQQGTLDMTIISLNNTGPFFPLIDTVHLPYIFQCRDHLEDVMLGEIGDDVHDRLAEATGGHFLGYTDMLFRSVYNTKRPIESLADMQGLKFRVPNNVIMIETYEAFGVNPTPLGWAETFSSTQTGIVDGGDVAPIHLFQSKLYEIAPHMALTEQYVLLSGFVIGEQALAKLTEEQQAILREAGREAGAHARAFGAKAQEEAIEELGAAGVQFTRPDKEAFSGREAKSLIRRIEDRAEVCA